MVSKELISKSISDAIIKCTPTIKQRFEGFDPSIYKTERYSRKDGQIKTAERSPVGALQQRQEDLQDEIDYNNEEKSMLSEYSVDFAQFSAYYYHYPYGYTEDLGEGTSWMVDCYKWEYDENGKRVFKKPLELIDFNIHDFTDYNAQTGHYSDGSWMRYDDYLYQIPFMKGIEVLDNMIDKSPPLQDNTVLYRVGVFDPNLKAGETSKFKSYTSTSFNSYVPKNGIKKYAGFNPSEDCYQLKIYAPKGTKGIVPCENTGCMDWQSEFTLGRNQKYIVLSVDNYKKTAEILLYK